MAELQPSSSSAEPMVAEGHRATSGGACNGFAFRAHLHPHAVECRVQWQQRSRVCTWSRRMHSLPGLSAGSAPIAESAYLQLRRVLTCSCDVQHAAACTRVPGTTRQLCNTSEATACMYACAACTSMCQCRPAAMWQGADLCLHITT
jgi:hypothetical protein